MIDKFPVVAGKILAHQAYQANEEKYEVVSLFYESLMKTDFAPLRKKHPDERPWEGSCAKKPWQYSITAAIPCLDTYEQVKICTELLSAQTERPYILLLDTGSCPEEFAKIEALRDDHIEVHSIRLNGMRHPSDPPAMAMDLAFTLCRTPFLYATHADCFVKRQNFLEEMLELCKKHFVVGYEISPRNHEDWRGMVSHTATMYHMMTMDKIGFGWSLRRLANMFDIEDYQPHPARPNWPDTEILGNYILRMNEIEPLLLGSEQNFSRFQDDNIDHFRSFTSGKLYCEQYFKRTNEWFELAKKEALRRLAQWKERN